MKITNETKIGILTVIAITILILGYSFLRGRRYLFRGAIDFMLYITASTLPYGFQARIGKRVSKLEGSQK